MSDLNSYEEGLAVDLAKAEAVIKAMTEQLEAARADAKEAETYAEELERECKRVADINANHCLTINTYVVDNAKLAAALKEAVGLINGWYHWDDERQLRGGAPSNYTEAARAFLAKHGEQR